MKVSNRSRSRGRRGKNKGGKNVQNKSPSMDPASVALSPAFFFRIPHSQEGYSPSSKATGSFFPFIKFKPFNGVPAATELFTVGAAFS
jgi:hypothetical protein